MPNHPSVQGAVNIDDDFSNSTASAQLNDVDDREARTIHAESQHLAQARSPHLIQTYARPHVSHHAEWLSYHTPRIEMGPSEAGGSSIASVPMVTEDPSTPGFIPPQVTPPRRPARNAVRPEPRRRNSALEQAQDAELVAWINRHIPNSSRKATDMSKSLATGLVLYRLAESIETNGESDKGNHADYGIPEVPDSAFPSSPNDDKLDGLFVLFDFLLDNDVRMGDVTINDVRSGDRDQLVLLVKAMRTWKDNRVDAD